jgi:hypothetical protein
MKHRCLDFLYDNRYRLPDKMFSGLQPQVQHEAWWQAFLHVLHRGLSNTKNVFEQLWEHLHVGDDISGFTIEMVNLQAPASTGCRKLQRQARFYRAALRLSKLHGQFIQTR